ncbi:hypothetical protein Afil01_31350 [Actinorhabdospora filicis]|uniref:Uncharacterized protein n=1 Tax=Actinorhabdospora filicis TaxID=1785913 RepID=A0A9W6SLR9_9ACTN|nr:hypothetical protein [Actinorhabdospora filicis]GLZ78328.1 hypothetical protein Afil01_31350 [Actinorhabdospora filicis]
MPHRRFYRHYLTYEQVVRITLPANPETARLSLAGRTEWVQLGRRHARVLLDAERVERIQLYAAGIQREPDSGRYYRDIPLPALPRLGSLRLGTLRPWRAGRLAAALQGGADTEIAVRHPEDGTLRAISGFRRLGLITLDIGPLHQSEPGALTRRFTIGDLHVLASSVHPRFRVLCRQFGDAGLVLRPVIGLGFESPSLRSLIPGAACTPGVLDRLIRLLQVR